VGERALPVKGPRAGEKGGPPVAKKRLPSPRNGVEREAQTEGKPLRSPSPNKKVDRAENRGRLTAADKGVRREKSHLKRQGKGTSAYREVFCARKVTNPHVTEKKIVHPEERTPSPTKKKRCSLKLEKAHGGGGERASVEKKPPRNRRE